MAWYDDWLGPLNLLDWAEGIIRGAMAGDIVGRLTVKPRGEIITL